MNLDTMDDVETTLRREYIYRLNHHLIEALVNYKGPIEDFEYLPKGERYTLYFGGELWAFEGMILLYSNIEWSAKSIGFRFDHFTIRDTQENRKLLIQKYAVDKSETD